MLRALTSRHLALGGRCAAAALASSTCGGWAAGGGAAAAATLASRGLHSSSALLASLQVKIPALGESISDGTVSAVLKQPGERVEEDEPILQAWGAGEWAFVLGSSAVGRTRCAWQPRDENTAPLVVMCADDEWRAVMHAGSDGPGLSAKHVPGLRRCAHPPSTRSRPAPSPSAACQAIASPTLDPFSSCLTCSNQVETAEPAAAASVPLSPRSLFALLRRFLHLQTLHLLPFSFSPTYLILQIETDKVTVDVRAPRAGVIEAILVRSVAGACAFSVHLVSSSARPGCGSSGVAVCRLWAGCRLAAAWPCRSTHCRAPSTHRCCPACPPAPSQVKPDENVEVGHVVASIAEGATAEAAAPQPAAPAPQQQAAAAAPPPKRAPKAAAAPKPAAAKAPAPAAAAPKPPSAAGQRTPSIRFPPRRTPEGEVLSAMPPAQAKQLLVSLLAPAKPAAQPIPAEYMHMIAVPIVGGSMPILRGMPVPSGPPGPPRRTMSDAEMEAIMLGGAVDS